MTPVIKTPRAEVYNCTWRELAGTLPTHMSGATLAIVDGPYNLGIADWDCFKSWDAFVEWYGPELEELSRVLAESAVVFLWGTDEGEARLRPLMRSLGWQWRGAITWDKTYTPAMMGAERASVVLDGTERCGAWARGGARVRPGELGHNVWRLHASGFRSERLKSGRLVPDRNPRREGRGDVVMVNPALHPCQKPLAFYDRLIRAASMPGDVVLEPFGGTLRAAVACQRLPASGARRALVSEPHRPYIEAARPALEFVPASSGAPSLFGGLQ